jgi:ribosomal protein L29
MLQKQYNSLKEDYFELRYKLQVIESKWVVYINYGQS